MSNDGSEYVSNHDRGAFGKLLAEAKGIGCSRLTFSVLLEAEAEDETRWEVESLHVRHRELAHGRTGEEALRRLVEKLRGP